MHCALCSIWSSQPQTRGRGGVQASSEASAPPALIWYVRPCGLCCVCAGWWLDMCVLECSRKKTFFVEHFCSVLFLLYILNDTYILDIMIQCSTHCTAYHKVHRFCHLKVANSSFEYGNSCQPFSWAQLMIMWIPNNMGYPNKKASENNVFFFNLYQFLPVVDTYRVVDSFVKTRPKRLHPLLLTSMFLVHIHHRDVSFLSKKSPASELLASLLGSSVSGRRSSKK